MKPPASFVCPHCGAIGDHYPSNCEQDLQLSIRGQLEKAHPYWSGKLLKRMAHREFLDALKRNRKLSKQHGVPIPALSTPGSPSPSSLSAPLANSTLLAPSSDIAVVSPSEILIEPKPSISSFRSSPSTAPVSNDKPYPGFEFEDYMKRSRKEAKIASKIGQKIVFDLSFESLMTEVELSSLRLQIGSIYGLNLHFPKPSRLVFTSLTPSLSSRLEKLSGFHSWEVERHQEHFTQVFPQERQNRKLVFLTPDSPRTLEEVKTDEIYVIGGFVDKQAQKGVSFQRALQYGVETAKLPLKEHAILKRTDRLPINQVFHLLMLMLMPNKRFDWKTAIKYVVPCK